jgi:striatin 1/3/4
VDVPGSSEAGAEVVGATAVEAIKTILRWVAVGYRDSVVKIFDVESGKEIAVLQVDGVGECDPGSRIFDRFD